MNKEILLNLFRSIYRIRAVEEQIALMYPQEEMRCPVHLSIGQESIPAVFSELIYVNDFAVSTHRSHAHYLAKGGNLNAMIAELYGKATGCAKGKGGSMHLIDLNVNFMGTSAIVGNSIPVGVGLALSAQLKNSDQISCIFLGDGAVEEGVFYESVNFAAVRGLPVVFICENNLYSVYSPLTVRQPVGRSIAGMVEGMGIRSAAGDSNNIFECLSLMQNAFDYARSGNGPFFLEFATYRWREHCGHNFDNDIGYRANEEFLEWKDRDPLELLFLNLVQSGYNSNDINKIKSEINIEIDTAFQLAKKAPFPQEHEAYDDVYAPQESL